MPVTSNPPPFRVFWQPGCSSCVRTKEFLQKRGVPFESVNVLENSKGMDELRALGARSVPIVSRGREYTLCQSIADVAKFVGISADLAPSLPPEQLFAKFMNVLVAASRYTRQFPHDRLRDPFRGRDRTLGDTAFHVFRVAEMGLTTAQGTPLRPEGFADKAPASWGAPEIAAWGDEVRGRLETWWEDADRSLAFRVRTYYGEKSMHEVLERTAWHAAQHVRQLMLMLEGNGVAPDRPLTGADLAGLPVPDDPWG